MQQAVSALRMYTFEIYIFEFLSDTGYPATSSPVTRFQALAYLYVRASSPVSVHFKACSLGTFYAAACPTVTTFQLHAVLLRDHALH